MAFRFNPSSNKGTDKLLSLVGSLALEEQKTNLELKKTKEEQKQRKLILEEASKLASGGLFQGQGFAPNQEQDEANLRNVRNAPLPREAVMSLPGGDAGDVLDRKVAKPFIINPNYRLTGKGEPLIKNPSFIAPKTGAEPGTLSAEQEVKARALSQRLFKTRGMEKSLPSIVRLMKDGKSVDEIEDIIRFSSQSEEFTGAYRSAASEILIDKSDTAIRNTFDVLDDEISKGNVTGVKSKLKRLARKSAGTTQSAQISGKERTVEFLGEIQENLDGLAASGIDTNIFSGTIEEINAKIGRVAEPELRKVATKIKTAIMNYRRAMSGAAFSVPESAEYTAVFPSISKTADFNAANISALSETFQGDLDSFYGLSMGPENYKQLFGEVDVGKQDDEYSAYLQAIGVQ